MAPRLSRIAALLGALAASCALAGCGSGEEDPAAAAQTPAEQVHELARDYIGEGGEKAEEEMGELRSEYEAASSEREESPAGGQESEAEAEAEAEAEGRQAGEEAQEAAEEDRARPERGERPGRLLGQES